MHLILFFLQLMVESKTFYSPVSKFEAQTIDAAISIGYGLALGDVDGDGKPDILLADKKQFVWYRNGDWKRFVMVDSLTEYDNVCIAARDLDGDRTRHLRRGAVLFGCRIVLGAFHCGEPSLLFQSCYWEI